MPVGLLNKRPVVYILASAPFGALYVGVTTHLPNRMAQHSQGLLEGFSKQYGVTQLVYYEHHDNIEAAIDREKKLKAWRRNWKCRLIMSMNPEWINLYDEQTGEVLDGPVDGFGGYF